MSEKLVAQLTKIIYDPEIDLTKRIKAAETLGEIGDPRDLSESIHIPAGWFIMGEGEEAHLVYLDEYWIDKYPVTNYLYEQFLKDKGYYRQEFWSEKGWKWRKETGRYKPWLWDDPRFNKPNYPVLGISWYEAEAYANWKGRLLPTEAQWEKAARGVDERKYPWGDKFFEEFCNTYGNGINGPTPVGLYLEGASPYNCMDMAGNVWEWCRDWFDENYYFNSPKKNPQGPETGKYKVRRGGSWLDSCGLAQCTWREYELPGAVWLNYGFRTVFEPERKETDESEDEDKDKRRQQKLSEK
jgi:iron(II)-dependent oxidoreductase